MDDFIKQNRAFLMSLTFMLFGIYAAGYAYLYHPYKTNAAALFAERGALVQELDKLRKARKPVPKPVVLAEGDRPERIRSVSDFLEHINETARRVNVDTDLPKVTLLELTPDSGSQLNYRIEIRVDYPTFLKFTAELELRDLVINDLEVRELDSTQNPPLHLVRFKITPRNDLKELPPGELRDRAQTMLLSAKKMRDKTDAGKRLRNPFQQLVGDGTVRLIPLTNLHRLSFIGLFKGQLSAEIDRRNYFVGDTLVEARRTGESSATGRSEGKVITAINEADGKVYLEETSEAGIYSYVIGFPEEVAK